MRNLIGNLFFVLFLIPTYGTAGTLLYAFGNTDSEMYNHPSCIWKDGAKAWTFEYFCNNKSVMYVDENFRTTYNTIDFDVSKNARSEILISEKSVSNVFLDRPLDDYYAPYSNDGILDKPVIFVEGYDPNNDTPPQYYYQQGIHKLITEDNSEGRDLFIVNFSDGSATTDANAALLQKIILEINNAKQGSHPIAVIGYSMGGIIAKKALKNMENAGINHQTSLYVSYDTPHQGVNTPLSLQETIEKIISEIDSKAFGYTPSALKRARNIYNSPAAREMLIAAPNFQPALPSSFPQQLARIAVTSGSMLGATQANFTIPNETVSDFRFYLEKNKVITWSINGKFVSKNRGDTYYDNTPGSYLYQFDDALSALRSGAKTLTVYKHSEKKQVTFIPTNSSLSISGSPLLPAKDRFKYFSPFDMYVAVDTTGSSSCVNFENQSTSGANIPHNDFETTQIVQIKCALKKFHKLGASIPDRSFKSL